MIETPQSKFRHNSSTAELIQSDLVQDLKHSDGILFLLLCSKKTFTSRKPRAYP